MKKILHSLLPENFSFFLEKKRCFFDGGDVPVWEGIVNTGDNLEMQKQVETQNMQNSIGGQLMFSGMKGETGRGVNTVMQNPFQNLSNQALGDLLIRPGTDPQSLSGYRDAAFQRINNSGKQVQKNISDTELYRILISLPEQNISQNGGKNTLEPQPQNNQALETAQRNIKIWTDRYDANPNREDFRQKIIEIYNQFPNELSEYKKYTEKKNISDSGQPEIKDSSFMKPEGSNIGVPAIAEEEKNKPLEISEMPPEVQTWVRFINENHPNSANIRDQLKTKYYDTDPVKYKNLESFISLESEIPQNSQPQQQGKNDSLHFGLDATQNADNTQSEISQEKEKQEKPKDSVEDIQNKNFMEKNTGNIKNSPGVKNKFIEIANGENKENAEFATNALKTAKFDIDGNSLEKRATEKEKQKQEQESTPVQENSKSQNIEPDTQSSESTYQFDWQNGDRFSSKTENGNTQKPEILDSEKISDPLPANPDIEDSQSQEVQTALAKIKQHEGNLNSTGVNDMLIQYAKSEHKEVKNEAIKQLKIRGLDEYGNPVKNPQVAQSIAYGETQETPMQATELPEPQETKILSQEPEEKPVIDSTSVQENTSEISPPAQQENIQQDQVPVSVEKISPENPGGHSLDTWRKYVDTSLEAKKILARHGTPQEQAKYTAELSSWRIDGFSGEQNISSNTFSSPPIKEEANQEKEKQNTQKDDTLRYFDNSSYSRGKRMENLSPAEKNERKKRVLNMTNQELIGVLEGEERNYLWRFALERSLNILTDPDTHLNGRLNQYENDFLRKNGIAGIMDKLEDVPDFFDAFASEIQNFSFGDTSLSIDILKKVNNLKYVERGDDYSLNFSVKGYELYSTSKKPLSENVKRNFSSLVDYIKK
jgi:hypothetical protein